MIFVIAGREDQAKDWAHSQGLTWGKEARLLHSERETRGVPMKQAFVRVGNWYLHQDTARMRELEHMLQIRQWVEVSTTNVHEYLRSQQNEHS